MGGYKMTDFILGVAIIILAICVLILDRKKKNKQNKGEVSYDINYYQCYFNNNYYVYFRF